MTPPEPNDQMVEPAVSHDDIESWLNELEGTGGNAYDVSRILPSNTDPSISDPPPDTPLSPPPSPGEPSEQEPDEDEEDEEQGEQDHFVINGNRFAREDIERLYNFDQYLRANPDAAQRVAEALPTPTPQPGQPPVPPQAQAAPPSFEEPTPPEYLDLEDPQVRWQWETHVANQKHNFEVEQRFQRWVDQNNQIQQEQISRQAQADMQSALTVFRDQYPGLSDEDVTQIRNAAGPYVQPMMAQLPPVEALRRSMEVAAWADADLRPKLNTETPAPSAHQRSRTRKQRLNSLSGSPRSAPKTEDRVSYMSDKDMVNAFANALAEQGFTGNQ